MGKPILHQFMEKCFFPQQEIKKSVSCPARCKFPMGRRQDGWESSGEVMNEFHSALTLFIAVSVIYLLPPYLNFLDLWEIRKTALLSFSLSAGNIFHSREVLAPDPPEADPLLADF